MLTKKDLVLLKGIHETLRDDIVRQNRDETRALIAASEQRMTTKIEALGTRMDSLRTEIVYDICTFIDEAILPELNTRLYRAAKINKKTT